MKSSFKIGAFQVNPKENSLVSNKGISYIEPKTMSLLLTLAEAGGGIVSRQALFHSIWGEQIVSDYALNTLVANLRKCLGDDAGEPQYIETRPKLGYRLLPQVEPIEKASVKTYRKTKLKNVLEEKNLPHIANIKIPHSLFLPFLFLITVVVIGLFLVYQYRQEPKKINPLKEDSVIQFRYISRVNILIEHSDLKSNGEPICIDTDSDFVTKLVYAEKQWSIKNYKWTLYSDFFDVTLDYTGRELSGVKETHKINHGHPYGIVEETMKISFDELENFSGSTDWIVFDNNKKEICKGSSLFIAKKI
jgi:DNA-binding winged helix-turn-helix (wHTH) protein